MSNEIVVAGVSMTERMLALRDWCLTNFPGKNVHPQIIRAMIPLVDDNPSPIVHLSEQYKAANGGTPLNGQILVATNDAFAFCGMKIGIRKAASAAAVTDAITYTYPSLTIFNAVGEIASIQGFWNAGTLAIDIEGNPALQPLANSFFLRVPHVQDTATTQPSYSSMNEMETFTPVLIDRVLTGDTDNIVKFDLKGNLTVLDDGGTNYLVVELVGFRLHTQASAAGGMAKSQNAAINCN